MSDAGEEGLTLTARGAIVGRIIWLEGRGQAETREQLVAASVGRNWDRAQIEEAIDGLLAEKALEEVGDGGILRVVEGWI